MIVLITVNPTFLKLIILNRFILLEKYDNISENVTLKNSKYVINICCYAPRHMYTHNAHPCFEWYIPSKSPIFTGTLNVESGNINGGFLCIFGRLKVWICKIMAYEGWSIINWCMNGVHEWDWVHERFLCPRAQHALNPIHEPLIQHVEAEKTNKWFWNHESRLNIHESMWIQW